MRVVLVGMSAPQDREGIRAVCHATTGLVVPMATARVCYVVILILSTVFISGVGVAVLVNTDYGNVEVMAVSIPNRDGQLSGLMYRPRSATASNPLPAVVLAHGISGNKQMLSGIALELSRRNIVALTIDLVGHGNSEGQFGGETTDLSLGALSALRYLELSRVVNASLVGVVGHSLGAGVVRAISAAQGNVMASVLIAGGLGEMVANPAYGTLNSTYPKNLLVAIGQLDILFDLDVVKRELSPAFGVQDVIPGHLYGSFSNQTARKLVTPVTTHLFEPVDPTIVSEAVFWMVDALGIGKPDHDPHLPSDLVYLQREAAVAASSIALLGLVFPVSLMLFDRYAAAAAKEKPKTRHGVLQDWKAFAIWGMLGVLLFLPAFLLGLLIPVPPMIFGSSFAWWVLSVALFGLLFIRFVLPKISTVRLNLRVAAPESFDLSSAAIAIVVFALLFVVAALTEAVTAEDLRIVVPLLNDLKPKSRVIMFEIFLPFFLVYFFVEGFYLHGFHRWRTDKNTTTSNVLAALKVIGIKSGPYAAILCIQYIPMLLLNIRVFPSLVGFLGEFFWGIIPLFVVSIAYSWWFYRQSSTVGMGVIFNSLLFAWSAAATLPLASFPIQWI